MISDAKDYWSMRKCRRHCRLHSDRLTGAMPKPEQGAKTDSVRARWIHYQQRLDNVLGPKLGLLLMGLFKNG